MSKSLVLVRALLVGSLSPFAVAQSSLSGAISGTASYAHASAHDAAHRIAVSDAEITLQSADTAERFHSRTGANGEFRVPELKPGDYSLKATGSGFADLQIPRVTVEVGRITEVQIPFDMAGAPEVVREVVEVRGEAPAVNTTQADFASNITAAPIQNLPSNGRRWSDFAPPSTTPPSSTTPTSTLQPPLPTPSTASASYS